MARLTGISLAFGEHGLHQTALTHRWMLRATIAPCQLSRS